MAKSNRSKWQMGEQKQRFAIRKFSQGVFSVLVGTMFVFGTPAVIQGDEIAGTHIGTKKKEQYQIKFQHVTENSLTSEQRAKVIYDSPPKTKVGSDQVYYLVYRPVATQNLPQTGELEMPWELGLFGATALIMGLGVLPKRARKYRFLTAIIVASTVVGVGSSVASASPNFAELSSYDRACLVAEDENSPEISTQHAGYQYIGYILVSDIKHPGESVPTTRPVTEKVVPNSDKTPNTGSAAIEVTKPEIQEGSIPTVVEETKVEPVGYETQYVDDPELLEGTTNVRTPGQAGERTIVYEVTRDAEGKELNRVEKSNMITKAPVTEVIARGTKVEVPEEPKVTVSEEMKTEPVGYETQYVDDPELLEGTTSVQTAGQAGKRTIVYEVTRDAEGKELNRVEKSNTITKAPVTEVIARGTKVEVPEEPKVTVSEEMKTEPVGYETQYVDDPELLEGTTSVRTAGQAGERTIVYEVTRDAEGKELSRVEKSNTITKAPVTEVVVRGTKPKTTVTEEVVLEEIPYTSELQNDPELFIGTTVVKTAGQAGERTIIYEVTRDAEGKELARVEKSSKITKAPVNEVVAQGTKLYAKPLVELTSADEAVDNKTATVSYTVTDPDKKLRAIKVSLYKDNEKVTEKLVDLATLTTTFADLAYNTNYRLETEYTYDIGQGDQTENLKPITVELTPKKVELKNFNNIGLYQLGANGGLELVSSLAELPTDPNKYVAKIVSAQQKDWYLPIASFEEVELGGKTKYQATIATPELVTYQADKRDFSAGHTFLIDKTEVSNEYTNFAELLKAIKADPTGDFILAADLDALGLADTDASYITETFL
ncbi:G5 domain-containing protein [Ligilactobacillus animalis]|uniref:G5 domain-containing protein n=2 Tax=Ligilactobacillus animalis TaxID=1605 RepID=A0AAJ6K288_9LACO|nr:G5 domain-containing protein [Ligilactobacillus animalis]WHQ79762.1 G5 domain-containing protein [Ligilactobacillus animalis]